MQQLGKETLAELAAECRRLFPGLMMVPQGAAIGGEDDMVSGWLTMREDNLMQLRFVIRDPQPPGDHVLWSTWRPGRLSDDVAAMERLRAEMVSLHRRLGVLLGVSDG